MRVLWVCNIMLPVIAQALSQEYSVREGWLSGILGRYLETQNGAELSAADVTDSAASPGGRQQGAETAAALTLGIAFPVAPGREELSQRLQLGSYKKEVACYGFAEDLEHPERYDSAMEARFLQILEDFQPAMPVRKYFTDRSGRLWACRDFVFPARTTTWQISRKMYRTAGHCEIF